MSSAIGLLASYGTIVPDREVWREAGILSGLIARLQGYGQDQRRRAMNDALLFATARKHGRTVLTRNTIDFDFLQQLNPSSRLLFYAVWQPGERPLWETSLAI